MAERGVVKRFSAFLGGFLHRGGHHATTPIWGHATLTVRTILVVLWPRGRFVVLDLTANTFEFTTRLARKAAWTCKQSGITQPSARTAQWAGWGLKQVAVFIITWMHVSPILTEKTTHFVVIGAQKPGCFATGSFICIYRVNDCACKWKKRVKRKNVTIQNHRRTAGK